MARIVSYAITHHNTQQVETTGKADFIRRTAKARVTLGYLTSFNETDCQTAADGQRATGAWNRYIQPRLYVTPLTDSKL